MQLFKFLHHCTTCNFLYTLYSLIGETISVVGFLMLYKLYNYGFRGIAHKWFCSYLSERYQFTSVNYVESDTNKITCGVPQGSPRNR